VDAVIAVDDASTDGARRILESLNCPRLTVLYHEENQGVGGAGSTGYEHALQIGAQIVVKVDGDGQMNADRIQELIDIVIFSGISVSSCRYIWRVFRCSCSGLFSGPITGIIFPWSSNRRRRPVLFCWRSFH